MQLAAIVIGLYEFLKIHIILSLVATDLFFFLFLLILELHFHLSTPDELVWNHLDNKKHHLSYGKLDGSLVTDGALFMERKIQFGVKLKPADMKFQDWKC